MFVWIKFQTWKTVKRDDSNLLNAFKHTVITYMHFSSGLSIRLTSEKLHNGLLKNFKHILWQHSKNFKMHQKLFSFQHKFWLLLIRLSYHFIGFFFLVLYFERLLVFLLLLCGNYFKTNKMSCKMWCGIHSSIYMLYANYSVNLMFNLFDI